MFRLAVVLMMTQALSNTARADLGKSSHLFYYDDATDSVVSGKCKGSVMSRKSCEPVGSSRIPASMSWDDFNELWYRIDKYSSIKFANYDLAELLDQQKHLNEKIAAEKDEWLKAALIKQQEALVKQMKEVDEKVKDGKRMKSMLETAVIFDSFSDVQLIPYFELFEEIFNRHIFLSQNAWRCTYQTNWSYTEEGYTTNDNTSRDVVYATKDLYVTEEEARENFRKDFLTNIVWDMLNIYWDRYLTNPEYRTYKYELSLTVTHSIGSDFYSRTWAYAEPTLLGCKEVSAFD